MNLDALINPLYQEHMTLVVLPSSLEQPPPTILDVGVDTPVVLTEAVTPGRSQYLLMYFRLFGAKDTPEGAS